jgi:hypothetical protein
MRAGDGKESGEGGARGTGDGLWGFTLGERGGDRGPRVNFGVFIEKI